MTSQRARARSSLALASSPPRVQLPREHVPGVLPHTLRSLPPRQVGSSHLPTFLGWDNHRPASSQLSGLSPWTPFRPTARHTAAKSQQDQPTLSGSPITHGREALEPRVLPKLAGKANTQSVTMDPEQQSVRLLGDPAPGCPHSLLRGASHPLTSPWHRPHHTDTGGAPDWEHPGQGLTFNLLQAGLGPEPRTWCGESRQ